MEYRACFFDLPEVVYNILIPLLPRSSMRSLLVSSTQVYTNIVNITSKTGYWEGRIATTLHIEPTKIVVPTNITREKLYYDLLKITNMHNFTSWFTGGEGSDDEDYMNMLFIQSKRSSARDIARSLLTTRAEINYTKNLPHIDKYPDPSIVKLKVTPYRVDVGAPLPPLHISINHGFDRPILSKENVVTVVPVIDGVGIDPLNDRLLIECYDATRLVGAINNQTIEHSDVFVFRNVVMTSHGMSGGFIQAASRNVINSAGPENLATTRVTNNNNILSLLRNTYCTFAACKSQGLDRVYIENDTEGKEYQTTVFICILAAYVAGITSLVVPPGNFGMGPISMVMKSSKTLEQFITRVMDSDGALIIKYLEDGMPPT